MSNSQPSEERYPLLLLLVDDGNRTSRNQGRILIDKSRYSGIASGASTVITQWPGHLTTCWLTALMIVLTITLLGMTTFATTPVSHKITTRCNSQPFEKLKSNVTVHLVHGPTQWSQSQLDILQSIVENYPQCHIELIMIKNANIEYSDNYPLPITTDSTKYVARDGNVTQEKQAKTDNYEEASVTPSKTIPMRYQKTSTQRLPDLKRVKRIKRFTNRSHEPIIKRKKKYLWDNDIELNINVGTKKLLKMLLLRKHYKHFTGTRKEAKSIKKTNSKRSTKIKTIDALLKKYPAIKIINSSFEVTFKNSPLSLTWQNLNLDTQLFAVRILCLWNEGGISFNLPELTSWTSLKYTDKYRYNFTKDYSINSNETLEIFTEENIFFGKFIAIGFSSFESLPNGVVTVDTEGWHMESKTVCHAFFEEMLVRLRDATNKTTPTDIIKSSLKSFCARGSVDSGYCDNLTDFG